MLKLWFSVHAFFLLMQIALLVTSLATFVSSATGNNSQGGISGVIAPWAAFGVSGFAITFGAAITFGIYWFQRQRPSSTEEKRVQRRRVILAISALFSVVFAAADAAFAGLFAQGGESAACGVAAVAALSAFAALVVDVLKMRDDSNQNKAIRRAEAEQYRSLQVDDSYSHGRYEG